MKKQNRKNFTAEQINEIWNNQNNKCDYCGINCCEEGTNKIKYGKIRHIKQKKYLTNKELEEYGNGGGIENGVGLCNDCYLKTENMNSNMGMYRSHSWQEIGYSEVYK